MAENGSHLSTLSPRLSLILSLAPGPWPLALAFSLALPLTSLPPARQVQLLLPAHSCYAIMKHDDYGGGSTLGVERAMWDANLERGSAAIEYHQTLTLTLTLNP